MKNNSIGLYEKSVGGVAVLRADGLLTVRQFYGVYDLILECGGNISDMVEIKNILNNGGRVRFGSLLVWLDTGFDYGYKKRN